MKFFIQNNLTLLLSMLSTFFGEFGAILFSCFSIYNSSKDSSLQNKLITIEKGYFITWLLISLEYYLFISASNHYKPFSVGIKGILSILGWEGTICYLLSALLLCVFNYNFCKNILKYKKHSLLFIKFIRSIMNTMISWLLIIIFMYNNVDNNQVPFLVLMAYITLSIVIAFLYPLLDIYQYTFKEVEKLE